MNTLGHQIPNTQIDISYKTYLQSSYNAKLVGQSYFVYSCEHVMQPRMVQALILKQTFESNVRSNISTAQHSHGLFQIPWLPKIAFQELMQKINQPKDSITKAQRGELRRV